MHNPVGWIAAIAVASSVTCAAAGRIALRLEPEQPTTLRVGQVAAVHVTKPEAVVGSAGTALALIRRSGGRTTRTYVYRAVEVGNHTLVVAPTNRREGDCISCVTTHYYVTVVR